MVVIIIGREFAVMGLRSIAVAQGVTIPASNLGKGKMTTQVVAILLLILGKKFLGPLHFLGKVALWVTVILALVSGLDYFLRFKRVVSQEQPNGESV
jgi:CDP-diacylglycerol--glycerol-3-phosphate 3-phosphatidyltransferase